MVVKEKIASFLNQNQLRLINLKGISLILTAKLISQISDIERFANINKFVKYAGISPIEKSSGEIKRYKRGKIGNRRLNSAFYLIALNQLRWNPKAKEYFLKKLKEGKTKKQALRCLMKRTACIVYGILKSNNNQLN